MRTQRYNAPIRVRVGYQWFAPDNEPSINESPLDKLLEAALRNKVITQFDTGRGRTVWFNGAAGPKLRKLRNQVRALLPTTWVHKL